MILGRETNPNRRDLAMKKDKGADQKESSPGEGDSQAPEGALGITLGTFPPTYFLSTLPQIPTVPISCLPYCPL